MKSKTRLLAEQLESLLPQVMNTLFQGKASEPLSDLPLAQLKLMRLLAAGNDTPSHISEKLGLSVSAVTQMSARLESMGLVVRTEDESDRRVRWLSLTSDAAAMMQERKRKRISRAEKVLRSIPDEHRQALVAALGALLEASKVSISKQSSTSQRGDSEAQLVS